MQLGFIFVLIVSIFIAIFAIQNGNTVPVDLFLATYEIPLAVVIISCLILGAVIVLILGTFRKVKKMSETKELKNKIKVLESEKVQFENINKTLEAEISDLKENNSGHNSRISELQTKSSEQSDTILRLTRELEELKESRELNESTEDKGLLTAEIHEEAGLEASNEKSEAHSE